MELTDIQKKTIAAWLSEGLSLSDVQKRLDSEFDISMTYMDVRFLVLDLGLSVQDKPEVVKSDADLGVAATPPEVPGAAGGLNDAVAADGNAIAGAVSVEIDRVVKPGSIVSGSVVFSDGKSAMWALDQLGRLAIDAGDPEYRPSESDLREFQQELKAALEKRGF